MRRRLSSIIVIAILLSLLIALIGCGKTESNNGGIESDIAADIDAKVGTWKTPQTIQPFFYQNYLHNGDSVEVLPFTNPGDMKTALLAGSLDMCGTTIVTAITAASKGEPIVLVAGLSNKCSALVVGKDSGIETGSDLKGKKIAYVPGTMHHLLLLEVLAKNGIDSEKDVELIRIDFFDMGQALAQGVIDAFYSGEPYPSTAVADGFGKILLYPDDEDGFGIINSAMMTTKAKVEKEKDLISKLVSAHVKATEELGKNREMWIEKSLEFGTEKEILDIALDNVQLFWNIDDDYLDSVAKLAQRMFDQGLITEIPDVGEMFDLSFINNLETDI
ncbi:MAG TPA: ABC transporter substrate-binding protein [Anaerovoracaceae bacterium]|nr:ABC transporter substrate-binding protein [Anaerovoracaceae bacterium]